jgi:FlaA1/EpsC-like NDP-sugar epimerase
MPIYLRRLLRIAVTWHLPFVALAALYTAYLLRFDFDVPPGELEMLWPAMGIAVLTKSVVFRVARLHRFFWKYVGIGDLFRLAIGNAIASVLFAAACRAIVGPQFSRSVYVLDLLLCFLGTAGVRFAVRLYVEVVRNQSPKDGKRILIYGAGAAGIALLREIRANPSFGLEVAGFLDDDPRKRGIVLNGVRVLGRGRDAAIVVDNCSRRRVRIEEIVIAMPAANGRQMQEALANCRAASVRCRTVPGVGELLQNKFLADQIRDVSVSDLLGREPVHIEEDRIRERLAGRCVLVTGAAGSIGSELSRQIASFRPRLLLLLDQAESDLFRIDCELQRTCPGVRIVPVLADIRDESRLRDVFSTFAVEAVYHAAAYKHVPMMEQYPLEAIRNNVLGTWKLARLAREHGVGSFLMISSDKAVNPTSVMGATKRVDELILSSMANEHTRFVSVRFGNVLGSNGSVIPTFQQQIQAGGPVTVTHEDMRRYFMTIREAVQLVLLASTMGTGSEIFVLDMGQPVRIVDLARQMIRLAGLVPGRDIEIRYVGLRPGEKLFEELELGDEKVLPTEHNKIRVLKGTPADAPSVNRWVADLVRLLEQRDAEGTVQYLKKIVPEFEMDARWRHRIAAAKSGDSTQPAALEQQMIARPAIAT